MANARLNLHRSSSAFAASLRCLEWRLLLLATVLMPAAAWATGGFDDEPPPSLPYYLDRLPAKPPSLIFQEMYDGATVPAKPVDFKAALLSLANDCEKGGQPAALLATTENLLAQARLDPWRAAALCNVLNDVHDLFAAAPPTGGKPAAAYIRWRVEHAAWFHLSWDAKKPSGTYEEEEAAKQRRQQAAAALDRLLADPAAGLLRVHWLYLRGACEFPNDGAEQFQQVIDSYPDHPRAEAARFMLARCRLADSRSHGDGYGKLPDDEAAAARKERDEARALFEEYLKRYPRGRFAADVPGWLGAVAFAEEDYLRALDCYVQQADVPGHPEVLKSAGFMCERCLSRLSTKGDQAALAAVAAHPRLAMSLVYLVVNTSESDNYDGQIDDPAQVKRWRRALLPRLAAEVARHKDAYDSKEWEPRYVAILAQAASGAGDQNAALSLCEASKEEITRNDDLAFIRLVALGRAHRLPEAIAAAREFARLFPKSPLAPGAALRLALALQDDHQAGAAVDQLSRLRRLKNVNGPGEEYVSTNYSPGEVYPGADADLAPADSVLRTDISGAEDDQLAQITDTLLNFAPLPELARALAPMDGANSLDGADEANVRAVLVQRWLAEEENFAEAKKYATPARWDQAAASLEKLTAEAGAASPGEPRAAACLKVADAWAAARGRLLFAPLETDDARKLFVGDAERAGIRRRDNGSALGLPAERINHALSSRDEWRHAFDWWLKTADAAPAGSAIRARALWSALRTMPSMALVSPYTFLRAGETDATALSRRLYDRLRGECPDSREAREFSVYYDLAPPPGSADANSGGKDEDKAKPVEPDLSAANSGQSLPYGEPEYRDYTQDGNGGFFESENDPGEGRDDKAITEITGQALALGSPGFTRDPRRLAREVARLRAGLRDQRLQRSDLFLVNFLDDLDDLLQEPAAKLTPSAIARYVALRTECMSVEHWGFWPGDGGLPPVPGATPETLNETVFAHIRAAYHEPEMAAFKDYLDFLALAVIANENIQVPVPGEMQDAKDGEAGKKEPVTYVSRDYPKLAKLAEGFLADHPRSRKREAARVLYARALYRASRPHLREKFAVWPQSGHFAGGTIIVTDREQPFDPRKIGAALNAYDREFPGGRYANEIRNLRGLLAWRTQDWPLALDLTLQTVSDDHDAFLQQDAGRRLNDIFVDGLTDDTERKACLAAIKARPAAMEKLRDFLPKSPYPLQALRSWIAAQ